MNEITSAPAYRAIVDLGKPMVPLLLKELEEGRQDWWFQALHEILDDGPEIPRVRTRPAP